MSFEIDGLFRQLRDGAVIGIDGIDVRLDDAVHPFEADNAPAIAAYWAEATAQNPALFNGRVMLPVSARLEDGVLYGVSRTVDFATFLYWAKRADEPGGIHLFAFAVPVSADNAILAIRMGAHTASAGHIYCAAGSFEPQDFSAGRMDFDANTRREVMEETGLDLGQAESEKGYWLLRRGNRVLLFRRYYFGDSAAALAARVEAHVQAETEPEIDGPVVIRRGEDHEGLTPHMRALIDWHFG